MDKKTSNAVFIIGAIGVVSYFFPWMTANGTSYYAALSYAQQSGFQILVSNVILPIKLLIVIPIIVMLINVCIGLCLIRFKKKELIIANIIGCAVPIIYIVLLQVTTSGYQVGFGVGIVLYILCGVLEVFVFKNIES